MSSPALAGSLAMLAGTGIWVLVKNEHPRAIQAGIGAMVVSMLLFAVDGFMPGVIPAKILIPVEFVLLSVMILGFVQEYGVRRQNLKEEGA